MQCKTMILLAPQGPDAGAEGMVTNKFVKMLRAHGWHVIWLFNREQTEYPAETVENVDDVAVNVERNIIGLTLTKLSKVIRIPQLQSIAWCISAMTQAFRLSKEIPGAILSSRVMPKYGHIPAVVVALFCRVPWLLNWSDPMPESKAPAPYGTGEKTPISCLMQILLYGCCKFGTWHTFPSERLQNLFLSYMAIDKSKCEIIPHLCVSPAYKKNVYSDSFILSYIGGGLSIRNPMNFFSALSRVRDDLERLDDFQIQFVGPEDKNVIEMAKNCGVLDLVRFMPPVTYEESIELMTKSSVNLVLEADMDDGVFLPSKVADIVSCNTPMLAVSPCNGVMHDLLERCGGGLWADCTSIGSIERSLRKMINDWKNNKLKSKEYSSMKLADEFSEDRVYSDFINLINRTTK